MQRLEEKNTLITGASSGIGWASALLFAQEGATVVGADINEEKGTEVVKKIEQAGGEAFVTGSVFVVDGGFIAR